MPKTKVTWTTLIQYAHEFDETELAEHRDEDGGIDTWTFDSVLADLEGDTDNDPYDGTLTREITAVIPQHDATAPVPPPWTWDPAACRSANRAVTFLPQTTVDERPALRVGGVQVYGYLDAHTRTVRVSVDVDDAEHLADPDGGVPVQFTCGGTVVHDTRHPASPGPLDALKARITDWRTGRAELLAREAPGDDTAAEIVQEVARLLGIDS